MGTSAGLPKAVPSKTGWYQVSHKELVTASNQLCIVTCATQRVGTLHPIASRPGRLEGRLAVPRTRGCRHRLLTKPFSHPSDQQDTPAHATFSMQDAHGDVGLLTAAARFSPLPLNPTHALLPRKGAASLVLGPACPAGTAAPQSSHTACAVPPPRKCHAAALCRTRLCACQAAPTLARVRADGRRPPREPDEQTQARQPLCKRSCASAVLAALSS